MKTISSRHNSLVKRIREAAREHGDEIVLEGPKQVADAIAGGWTPIAIATRGAGDAGFASDSAAERVALTDEVFDSISETRSPQDVIALFERPLATAEDILARRGSVAVALDGVQDPGNVGTIVRLAAAFDASGVLLLPGCADPYGPKAIRSSAGAILSVPVAATTVAGLAASGLDLVAADAGGATCDPPARGAVLVFGSEGPGVSVEIRRIARLVAIPMSPRMESLNVGSSAAILLARSYALRHPSAPAGTAR